MYSNFTFTTDVCNQLAELGSVYDQQNKQWVFNMESYELVLKYLEAKFNRLSKTEVFPIPDFVFSLLSNEPPQLLHDYHSDHKPTLK